MMMMMMMMMMIETSKQNHLKHLKYFAADLSVKLELNLLQLPQPGSGSESTNASVCVTVTVAPIQTIFDVMIHAEVTLSVQVQHPDCAHYDHD